MSVEPLFEKTYCSQCGGEFGQGYTGYSHCSDHRTPEARATMQSRHRESQLWHGVLRLKDKIATDKARDTERLLATISALHSRLERTEMALRNCRRSMICQVTGISDGITIWQVKQWIEDADAILNEQDKPA